MDEAVSSPEKNPSRLPLLATKLLIPRARQSVVARQRLTVRLNEVPNHALTLVSAPAGFGKTTLLAEWLRSRPERACWLSLDAADNGPARFLSYVIAALQGAAPGVAGDLVLPLRSPQPPAAEAVIAILVNELASLSEQIILALDDYHAITSPAVNSALGFLLEHLPPNIHLVIASRSDLPIPIARLRSRGQLAEIRADDLRFTPEEAAAFLGRTMGLSLSSAQVAALDERTEGWIAGLQMAALSMRGRDDVDGFIQAFAGTNRFILDFLVEEVLSREPEEVQTFLLQTTVLTRLSGPLCDAVTGGSGGQEMLERLERRNLFVVPLDDDRHWYRYHHLFADLLKARLFQSGPDLAAQLLSRAADWCERDGQFAEAVGYALSAKDYDRAAGQIARHWNETASTGEIETVASWLDALPEDIVRNNAPLGVVYCWILWLKGQVGQIEPRLDEAERAFGELAVPEGIGQDNEGYAALPAQLAALHSLVASYRNEFETASVLAERALALVPGNMPPEVNGQLRVVIYLAMATAYDAAGDLDRAADAYAKGIHLGQLGRSATSIALTYLLVRTLLLLGRLRAADAACRDALEYVQAQGMSRLPAVGILHVAMSEVLLERNDLEAAEAHLSRGMELGRRSGRLNAARNAAEALVRLHLARHDTAGALVTVQETESAFAHQPSPWTRAELLALKAKILVRQGALAEAAECIGEAERLAGDDRGQIGEIVARAAPRVLLARRKLDDAVAQLTRSLSSAETTGRWGVALEMRILRSLALARQGDTRGAEADLERALALAEPEGYVRIFVDEGEPLAELLRRLMAHQPRPSEAAGYSARYLATLLSAFEAPGGAPLPTGTGRAGPEAHAGRSHVLVEPLSEREREVARLMAEGLTNEQIAARLIIALGTVKVHVHNISGKLGAQNRAHAVALAKEHGHL